MRRKQVRKSPKREKSRKTYSQDVLGLMEMLQDIGYESVTRFGNKKQTEKALRKIYAKRQK